MTFGIAAAFSKASLELLGFVKCWGVVGYVLMTWYGVSCSTLELGHYGWIFKYCCAPRQLFSVEMEPTRNVMSMFTQTSDLQCSKRVDHSVGRTPYGVSEGEVKRAKRPDDTSLGCVYIIDPLQDIRWEQFLQVHHDACLFHSTAWLGALQRTYGYTPLVYTTSRPREPLRDGMVFCRVDSWLTGRRLVGLPFSDYCAPLIDS